MTKEINNITELVDAFYGGEITQVDAPMIRTTTGSFNATFSAKAWAQVNQDANTLGILPKYPWQRSGFRALTARAAASGGGLAEAAAVPDTIKPTFVEVTVTPKQIVHTFETSLIVEALSGKGDDMLDFEYLREQMAVHHAEMMNVMLHTDGDTLAGNNLESLDRVCASAAEATALSWTAADEDIYGIDRSAASWADAQVLHNSGTDRALTDSLIRTLIANTAAAGANQAGQVWVTGFDTAADIEGLYQTQVRYSPLGESFVQPSVEGVKAAAPGVNFGVRVATLYGRPIITDKNVFKDTKSRLYLVDTSDPTGSGRPRLGLCVAQPTAYYETKSPLEMAKTTREGLYITIAELVCTNLAVQGKIRELL